MTGDALRGACANHLEHGTPRRKCVGSIRKGCAGLQTRLRSLFSDGALQIFRRAQTLLPLTVLQT